MDRTMRAMVLEEPYKMTLKEVLVPKIHPNEVLIKIKYCGICGSDYGAYIGKYADEAALLPLVIGHEFCGVIEEMGADVPKECLAIGDRVSADICLPCGTCYHCRRGEPLLCRSFRQIGIHTAETSGGYSEYVKAPWQNLYKIPDKVTDYQAAFVEPLTATLGAAKNMQLKIASSLVVIGAGLGTIHACLGKLRGAAPIIIIDNNPGRLAMAKQMCADYTINFEEKDPVEEVLRLTGGIGADYVLEAVGNSKTYEQAFKMVRAGGTVEAFGICADDDYAALRPVEFVLQEKKVHGSCAGIGHNWQEALTLMEYGRIDPTPLISMVVPLEETEMAIQELRENKKLVKVLVSPEIKERQLLYK